MEEYISKHKHSVKSVVNYLSKHVNYFGDLVILDANLEEERLKEIESTKDLIYRFSKSEEHVKSVEKWTNYSTDLKNNYNSETFSRNLYVKRGDFSFKNEFTNNHENYVRVVSGVNLSKNVLQMDKSTFTIFVDPEDIENSKVVKSKSLRAYYEKCDKSKKYQSFKKFKNFCLLKDFPAYFFQKEFYVGSFRNLYNNINFSNLTASKYKEPEEMIQRSREVDLAYFDKVFGSNSSGRF